MTLKERVEQNVVVWLLGTLLTGFLGGIAAYRGIQEIGDIQPIARSRVEALEKKSADAQSTADRLRAELEKAQAEVKVVDRLRFDLDKAQNAVKSQQEEIARLKSAKSASNTAPPVSTPAQPPRTAPTADVRPQPPPVPRHLQGRTIVISFLNNGASAAVEAKKRLEALGIRVIRMEEWNYETKDANMIFYFRDTNLEAALAVANALRDFGVQGAKSASWKTDGDMVVWLRP